MKISIITVALNAEATILDTVASVRAQSHGDFEHIVVDGVSTDRTLALLRSVPDPRLKVVSGKDRGLYDAMNKGVALATGDLIGFLNSDDFYCRTDALARIAQAASANPQDAAVSAEVMIVDQKNPERVRRQYGARRFRPWMLRFGHMPPHPALYARAQAFARVGPFDWTNRIAGDFDWLVRFFLKGGLTATRLAVTVTAMRDGGVSTGGLSSMRTINAEVLRSLRRNGVWSATPVVWSKYLVKVFQLLGTPDTIPEDVRWPPAR